MPIDPNSLEKVCLFLSASMLTNVHLVSAADTFAVVFLKDFKTHQLHKIGSTEMIHDTSPTWSTSFTVDYMFEVTQEFVVKVFQCHDKKHPISDESKHTPIGEATFLLSSLMRSSGGSLSLDIDGAKRQKLNVRGEAVANTRDLFVATFVGNKLANKDGFFGVSDPFMEISRCNEDSSYTVVWKSPKIDNTLSPHWAETKIPMTTLCNGDIDRPLRIQLWDWESNGKHQSMGVVDTSVRAMLTHGNDMEVIEADKKAKTKGYTNSGHLHATNVRIEHYPPTAKVDIEATETDNIKVDKIEADMVAKTKDFTISGNVNATNVRIEHCPPTLKSDVKVTKADNIKSDNIGTSKIVADKIAKSKDNIISGHVNATNVVKIEHYPPTFAEFIQGGCEINLVVAIDFTASNLLPNNVDSLHYVDPSGRLNAYQTAISAVGSVLSHYDTDKKYSVFGFGARLKEASGGYSTVQHCFPVYAGGAEVDGLDGVLNAYKECLNNIQLSGPTLFGPIIDAATSIANATNCSQSKQKYTILLVLTDGTFEDHEATVDAIIAGSNQPLSIIMIGIGAADFSEIAYLDSDKQLLKRGNKTAARDIVQFVPYSKVAGYGSSVLAQQVLAEIPEQVLKYFEQHNILPNKH